MYCLYPRYLDGKIAMKYLENTVGWLFKGLDFVVV